VTPFAVRQRLSPGAEIPRHRHTAPYAAIVLAGGYEEAGDNGRIQAGPATVVLHDGFHAHLNRSVSPGTEVLNIALPAGLAAGVWRIADPDAVAQAAERDASEALAVIVEGHAATQVGGGDWPDDLAAALEAGAGLRLGDWARSRGLAAETLSRGFVQIFGVTPSRFRLEARTRTAWRALTNGKAGLATVASETGFADQAHMNRAVKALTGRTPGAWRGSNRFKTAA
jgi:AraC-like DNA-binding protein